ncbi:MAG: DEAD/DEAH box helicase [Ruminococcus flavefaciens]|nr:DEAD/DEAH box helicase [Ruminococcus flavefaciens]
MQEFIPHSYQKYCIDRIIENPAVGLFLDMGLGKTSIALTAIKKLKYEYWCVGKVLIVAPKKVAESTWNKEAAKWNQLSSLKFSFILGTQKNRVDALNESADVYMINRENVQWLVDYYRNKWPFDMVVIDESSSFKNHQAKRFKALKAIRSHINRIVLLTGTPTPRSLMDLWAQVYLLDGGKRLGRTITAYRDAYFVPDKRSRTTIFSYAPKDGASEEIYNSISDICISMKSEDFLELPDLIYEDIPVKLDKSAEKAYEKLERDTLLQFDEDTVITAGSAAVLSNKLLQLCNGAVYDEDSNIINIHDCKIEALLETVEQLNGQHAIICYNFKHDKDRLLNALKSTHLTVKVYEGKEQEDEWNAGLIDLLLVQPASCGYGLNLQNGGHHIIWFGLNWSLELYQQTNKRLHRQGQPYPVIVHHLIVQGGADEDVIKALDGKSDVQDRLIDALKARIHKAKENTA